VERQGVAACGRYYRSGKGLLKAMGSGGTRRARGLILSSRIVGRISSLRRLIDHCRRRPGLYPHRADLSPGIITQQRSARAVGVLLCEDVPDDEEEACDKRTRDDPGDAENRDPS